MCSWNFDLIQSLLPSTFKNITTDFNSISDGHTAADNLFNDLSAQYLYLKSWISHTASLIFSHSCELDADSLYPASRQRRRQIWDQMQISWMYHSQQTNTAQHIKIFITLKHPSQTGHAVV